MGQHGYQNPSDHPLSEKPCNRFDIYSLKGAIDDELTLWLESNKFVEHTKYLDIKIVLYVIACGLGYWSHFVVKFPQEWYFIVLALCVYAILMAVHWLIERKIEREAFFFSKWNEMSKHKEIKFRSQQEKQFYMLEIVFGSSAVSQFTVDVTELFDTYGYMHRQQVKEKVIDRVAQEIKKH